VLNRKEYVQVDVEGPSPCRSAYGEGTSNYGSKDGSATPQQANTGHIATAFFLRREHREVVEYSENCK
jgi:hypothetical protein